MLTTLPCSFYESLSGLENFRISAVCAGLRRSATTMLYQIVRDLFPEGGVIKSHTFLDVPADVPVIATVRDPRDCVVSWWRVTYRDHYQRNAKEVARMISQMSPWSITIVDCKVPTRDRLTVEDAALAVGLVKQDAFHLSLYRQHKRFLLLKYEDFRNDPDWLRATLEGFLRRPVPPEVISRHDLKHNWGLKRFTDVPVAGWDAATATAPTPEGHCNEGIPGMWRPFCDGPVTAFLDAVLRQELVDFGYLEGEDSDGLENDEPGGDEPQGNPQVGQPG